jgi:superfamily II DNA/RNA helicase
LEISTFFPVQTETLEVCRTGKDLVVRSKTGSGKTVAFALPTIEKILASKGDVTKFSARGSPKALVGVFELTYFEILDHLVISNHNLSVHSSYL